jgi:hypothetical protein
VKSFFEGVKTLNQSHESSGDDKSLKKLKCGYLIDDNDITSINQKIVRSIEWIEETEKKRRKKWKWKPLKFTNITV